MNLIYQHKALIITTLIGCLVVLLVFNVHLSRSLNLVAETYYEMEPEPEIEKQIEKTEEETMSSNRKLTNLAFNEAQKLKDIDDNYLNKIKEHYNKYDKSTESDENSNIIKDEYTSEKRSSYDEINDLLSAKNKSKEIKIGEGANKNSTMSYSLGGRTHEFLPTPVYLCESSGKIIINITVNQIGQVTEASVNGSSTSNNQCLIDHALEYAKNARFSPSSKTQQIGTIRFNFIGKN